MKKKFIKFFASLFMFVPLFSMMTACGEQPTNSEQLTNSEKPSVSSQTSAIEEKPIESEIDLTYSHTKTEVEWASEEVKKTQLEEMGIDEKTFFNLYDSAIIEVKFLLDNKAIVVFNMGGNGTSTNVFYKNNNQTISFYDSVEDMNENKVKNDSGFFSAQMKLSNDYKEFYWLAHIEGMITVTLICTIK